MFLFCLHIFNGKNIFHFHSWYSVFWRYSEIGWWNFELDVQLNVRRTLHLPWIFYVKRDFEWVEQLSFEKYKFFFSLFLLHFRFAISQMNRQQCTISLVFAVNVKENGEHLVNTILSLLPAIVHIVLLFIKYSDEQTFHCF